MTQYNPKSAKSIPRWSLVAELLFDWDSVDTSVTAWTWTGSNVTYPDPATWAIGFQKQYADFESWSVSNIANTWWAVLWTGNFSMFHWVNIESLPASWNFMGIVNSNSSWDSWSAHILSLWNDWWTHKWYWWYYWGGFNTVVRTETLAVWEWILLWVTWDWSTVRLYKNWVYTWTSWAASATPASDVWTKRIWTDRTNSAWRFDWKMAMARWYTKALTDAEITNLYQEWLRKLGQDRWSYSSLFADAINYWDFRWDMQDVIAWQTATNNGMTAANDRFWTNTAFETNWTSQYINTWASIANIHNWPYTFVTWLYIPTWVVGSDTDQDDLLWKATSSTSTFLRLSLDNASWTKYITAWCFGWGWEWLRIAFWDTTMTEWAWNMIVYQIDVNNTNGFRKKIYVNWINEGSNSAFSASVSNTNNFYISAFNNNWTTLYSAASSRQWEFIVYDRLLSDDEVSTMYWIQSSRYIYPFNKTLPWNLLTGMKTWVAWHNDGSNWADSSGEWNVYAETWTVTDGRILTHKFFSTTNWNYLTDTTPSYSFDGWTAVTVSCWVKPTSVASFEMIVISRSAAGVHWYIANSSWTLRNFVDGDSYDIWTIAAWEWQHIAMTWDSWAVRSNYINWKLVWAEWTPYTWTFDTLSWEYFRIAYNTASQGYWWDITEVMFWNRALSDTEIQQVYYSTYIQEK